MTVYRIGTFNLEYGRKLAKVATEVHNAFRNNELDALVVQEAKDYFHQLSNLNNLTYYCGVHGALSSRQVGILVKETHKVTRFKPKVAGNGWRTESGAYHGPVSMPQLAINEELLVKGIHLPTPSMWKNGKLSAPKQRIDDLKDAMNQAKLWLNAGDNPPDLPRIICGDWNEKPSTIGEFSPHWLATQTNSKIRTTTLPSPHGNIDYFICNGPYKYVRCYQDVALKERSDHELRVLVVEV